MSLKTISAFRHWKIIGVLLLLLTIGVFGVESSGVPVAHADDPTPNDIPHDPPPMASAIIDNGTVHIGVLDQGHLGVGVPYSSDPASIGAVGLRYVPIPASASTEPGCICEGWGVADAGTGQNAHADVAVGGVSGMTVDSFTSSGVSPSGAVGSVGTQAESVVTAFGRLRVTHDFHPTPLTPNLYEVDVTIENISTTDVTDLRYTRTMDWDIYPTYFDEYVTIQGVGSAANLLYADDNGFQDPNPLLTRSASNVGNMVDNGPDDHGAHFDFGFGPLPAGGTQTFRIYYGAAPTEAGANAALTAVGAEAYSFGQSNGGQVTGSPVTFIFAFSGVGGSVLIPPDLLLEPTADTNNVGETHTLTATLTDDSGNPVSGVTVTFEVVGGPNTGTLGTAVTNSSGVATISYSSTVTGTDAIVASFVDGDSNTQNSNGVTKEWVTPPNVAPTVSTPNSSVTVDEGDTANNNGSFSDPDAGDSVTISASVGTVTQSGSQSGTWSWSFNSTDGPAESQTVTITATDGSSAIGTTTFGLTVNNVAPNIDKGVVDLNTWTAENISSGSGVWTVDGSGNSVFQSVNGNPTFFYSDFSSLGSPLQGTIRVETTSDDDFIGFAIGFNPGDTANPSADYLLVDWKQYNQPDAWGYGAQGLAVSRVNGVGSNPDFWSHSGALTELARGITLGNTGWGDYQINEFQFDFTPTRLRVFVNGTLELDVTPTGPNFSDGRFAFFNFSQSSVRYSAIQSDSIAGVEASPVSFSKNFTDPGIPDTHTATINWGDSGTGGETVTSPSGSTPGTVSGTHTYADNGTYTVTVTVCDSDLDCDSDTFTATIANVDPTVDANGPYSVNEGSSVTLNATGFDVAGAADPLTYAWDLDNNGSFETPGQSAPFNGIDGPSTHTVNVQVNDGDGGTAVDSATVTVNNLDPVVTATGDTINEGDTATVSGTISDPGTPDSFTVVIDWGGSEGSDTLSLPAGSTSYSATHVYDDDDPTATLSDNYGISVTVTDDDGGIGSASATVTVNNVDPVIESGVVDLNSWTVENSSPGAGVWTVDGSGNSVFQSVNGNPTFFYSDFNALGSPLEGAIAVETGSDDDYIGFAIGFEPGDTSNPSADFLLVDWKQGDQSGALAGLAVSRVTGVPTGSDYWTHSGAITELARGITLGSTGWANYASNQFLFEFSPTRLRVFVNGTLELDVTPTGPNFSDGRFAFYNYSQYYVRYSAIQSDSISGNEASPVSFTKNFTDVGIPDTHTATILWGDTSSSAGTITEPSGSTPGTVSGTHTYADNGTYTVTVTVCDDDGGCDSDTFTATIANVDPTVDANGPYSVNEGSSVTLNATGFDVAGPADPLTYAWDLDNNGSFETPGQSVPFNGIDGPSTHTVNVQVNDGDGGIAVDTTTVTVNNVDPTIVTTFQVAPIPEASVSTSGNLVAQATDPAGSNDPLAFDFDCDNNGSYETPSNPSTSAADCYFDDNGSYTVGVRVTDGDGGQAIGSVIAVVTNVSPTAFIPNVGPVDEGSPAVITFEAEFDPSVADTTAGFHYSVACDGLASSLAGSYAAAGTSDSVNCVYGDNGTYTVMGRIFDKDDGSNDYSATVTVVNVDPVVTATGDTIDEAGTATVSGTITDPGFLDTFTVVIDWGPGEGSTTLSLGAGATTYSASHQYIDDDPTATLSDDYGISVTVTDDDGGVGTASTVVTVNNVDPELTLDLTGSLPFVGGDAFIGRKGVEQTHFADATDVGADDLTFDWTFAPDPTLDPETYLNGGSIPMSASDSASVTFAAPGIYTVEVDVTDDDGGSADALSQTKIVTDDCDCAKSKGFWKHQFKASTTGKGKQHIDDASLEIYLDIVEYVSSVFSEDVALAGIIEAHNVFDPPKSNNGGGTGTGSGSGSGSGSNEATNPSTTGSKKKKKGGDSGSGSDSDTGSGSDKKLEKKKQDALQQTLAAWLNFAKGGIDWDEDITIDGGTGTGSNSGSGTGSKPATPPVVMDFSDLIAEVEAILNNPLSTADDFEHAKDLAESVNKHDKDNPDCDTGSGSNSGSGSGSGSGTGSKSSKGGDDSGSGTGSKSSKDNKKNKRNRK